MNKRHLIGYPVAVILALTIGAAGAAGSTTTTPTPAAVVQTVTQAPAECGTALDFASEFAKDIAAEHMAMGDAARQASQDGDIATMLTSITAAMATVTGQMNTMAPPLTAAAQTCRAAIK